VDLIFDQVSQLEHIGITHRYRMVERLTGAPIVERHLAIAGQTGGSQHLLDLRLTRTIEDRCRNPVAQTCGSPTEVGLEDLADIHT
jgi:hypothetical protein